MKSPIYKNYRGFNIEIVENESKKDTTVAYTVTKERTGKTLLQGEVPYKINSDKLVMDLMDEIDAACAKKFYREYDLEDVVDTDHYQGNVLDLVGTKVNNFDNPDFFD
jgi:hypothetical protein